MKRVHRRELTNLPFNPHKIDAHAKRKLLQNLRTVGLIQPITWNKRTGHIVSGHKRIGNIDDLHGHDDYMLDVAVVDMDEKQEELQAIFMNNYTAQGEYDLDALTKRIEEKGADFDLEMAGFDIADLESMFDMAGIDSDVLAKVYGGDEQNIEVVAEINELQDSRDEAERKKKAEEKKIQDIKEARKKYREGKAVYDNDTDYYVTLVFPDSSKKAGFLAHLGENVFAKNIDARRIAEHMGIDWDNLHYDLDEELVEGEDGEEESDAESEEALLGGESPAGVDNSTDAVDNVNNQSAVEPTSQPRRRRKRNAVVQPSNPDGESDAGTGSEGGG